MSATNILDSDIPNIGVKPIEPTRYQPQQEVVEANMSSWYNWLVYHVPKTIKRRVKVAYRIMKDKV